MTPRPHDALFKAAFEDPAHATGIFRHLLPPSICEAVAWESAAQEPGSFIDPDLVDHHSDLLFSVRLRGGGQSLLYLLLEHQSSNDPDMPLRMLGYLVRIWERFRKQHGSGPLPVILPAVVSHAPGGWAAPRWFHELFAVEVMEIPGMAELVPRFPLLIEDLAHLSNEELKARALATFPTLVLWALRDARDLEQFLANLGYWATALSEAYHAPAGIQALAQLFRYVALVGDLRFEDFRGKLEASAPELKEITMTMAEQLRLEGWNKGRSEGRNEGRIEGRNEGLIEGRNEGRNEGLSNALRKQLTLKFGALAAEHEARISSASADELDRYLERILTAETVGGVLL